VRIARTADGEWLVNPTFEETEASDIDLVVAGSKDAIFMVEAGAKMVSEEDMLAALEFAQTAIAEFCAVQQRFLSKIDITPMEVVLDEPPADLWERVRTLGADKMRQALHNPDKHARMDAVAAVKEEIKAAFSEEELAAHGKHIKALLKRLEKETM
jgi:polyribonucleotide nucleotidyltransferase